MSDRTDEDKRLIDEWQARGYVVPADLRKPGALKACIDDALRVRKKYPETGFGYGCKSSAEYDELMRVWKSPHPFGYVEGVEAF